MANEDRIIVGTFVTYLIVGFLCFGWCYNHPDATQVACETDRAYYDKNTEWCDNDLQRRAVGSFLAGVGWPLWLTATLSIAVTKWP